jgi:uncharacterized protein (DUF2252 family)
MTALRKSNIGATKPARKKMLSRDEQYAIGKKLRAKLPRESHAIWKPSFQRPDPLDLLKKSSEGRIQQLLPLRYGRMLKSPFTFYRGSALSMAVDLSTMPVSGLRVQACGDCHLSNFGAFATPERRIIADINDLDETLPAPWEWDVKRLAASFVVASRDNGHSEGAARDAALACVAAYRQRMFELSKMTVLEVWYSSIDLEEFVKTIKDEEGKGRIKKRLEKARARTVLEQDFPELASTNGDAPVIRDNPPLIFHPREHSEKGFADVFRKAFADYRETLPEFRRLLLDRYQFTDIALKVVGVGSVGTACGVMLMMASEKDPLFLQFKEARASVLEPYAGKSKYANQGQRVVVGCQLMQAASDLFLGWTSGQEGRHFYVRQLKDMKIKPVVEVFTENQMLGYAELCGWILARAHARSGEPARISGYLGKSERFDQAIADFSVAYADQTERDHATLTAVVRRGDLEIAEEE